MEYFCKWGGDEYESIKEGAQEFLLTKCTKSRDKKHRRQLKHTTLVEKKRTDHIFKNHCDWQDHILQYRTEVTYAQSRQFLKEYYDSSVLVPIVSHAIQLCLYSLNQ